MDKKEEKGKIYMISGNKEKQDNNGKECEQTNNENKEKDEGNNQDQIEVKRYRRIIPMKSLFSKSKSVNGMRLALGIVCLGVFLYFAYENSLRYLTKDTMVTMSFDTPRDVDLPAVTICGPYIISPLSLASIDKSYRNDYNDSLAKEKLSDQSWLESHRKQFQDFELRQLEKSSVTDILENKSFVFTDIVNECFYRNYTIDDGRSDPNMNKINCLDIADVVGSIYDGKKCFTLFSRYNNFKQRGLKMRYEFLPRLEISVKTKDLLYSYGNGDGLIMSVHPKTIIPTFTDDSYYVLYEREEYEITFRIKNVTKLQNKRKTNCKNYLKDCKCKTRAHCIDSCVLKEISDELNCTVWYSVINSNLLMDGSERFCPKEEMDTHYELFVKKRKYCEDQCPEECVQINYDTKAKIKLVRPEFTCQKESDLGCNATIKIMLSKLPSIIITHMEEYPWQNFIGAVGGHLGVWLGLSFITVIDLALTLMEKGTQLWKINFPGA